MNISGISSNILYFKPRASPTMTAKRTLWQKIRVIVERIWKKICFWKKEPVALTLRQITLVDSIKKDKPGRYPVGTRLVSPQNIQAPPPEVLKDFPDGNLSGVNSRKFDESLEGLRDVIIEGAATISSILFELKVKDPLEKIKNSIGDIQEAINFVGRLAVQIGTKAVKPYNKIGKEYSESRPENKITRYINRLNRTLSEDLPAIIQATMDLNAVRIADILASRLADLVSHSEYKRTVDEFALVINRHVEAYVAAEKEIKELIAKAHAAPSAKDSRHLIVLREQIQSLGEAKYKHTKILQAFIQNDLCHPILKTMAAQEGIIQNMTERAFLEDMTERMIALFLPEHTWVNDGKIEEISGVAYMWKQLIFPEELNVLLKQGKELISHILNPCGKIEEGIFEEFKAPLYKMLENIFVTIFLEHAKPHIITKVFDLHHRLVAPEKVQSLITAHVLPKIYRKLLPLYAQMFMTDLRYVQTFAAYFKQSILRPELTEETFITLLNILFELVKSHSNEPIEYGEFCDEVLPLLEDIHRVLCAYNEVSNRESDDVLRLLGPLLHQKIKSAAALYIKPGIPFPEERVIEFINSICSEAPRIIHDTFPEKLPTLRNFIRTNHKRIADHIMRQAGMEGIEINIGKWIIDELTDEFYKEHLDEIHFKTQLIHYMSAPTVSKEAPFYGEMGMRLGFDCGEFELEGIIGWFADFKIIKNIIQNTLQEVILGSLDPYRQSHHEIINISTETVKGIFSDRAAIIETISEERPVPREHGREKAQNTFDSHIHAIATLAHGIISKAVADYYPVTSKFIHNSIGGPLKLEKAIKTCFHKLLSDRFYTANLSFQMQDVALRALQAADLKIRNEKNERDK